MVGSFGINCSNCTTTRELPTSSRGNARRRPAALPVPAPAFHSAGHSKHPQISTSSVPPALRAPLSRRRPNVQQCAAAEGSIPQPTSTPSALDSALSTASKALKELPVTWILILSYISLMLLVPILALLTRASQIPLDVFIARATEPVALHAYYVTFSMASLAALANAVFGFILAWVLVKYKFPGRKWIDAAVDLPFALPTSVAGLTLVTVYSDESPIGALLQSLGINVVFTRLGVAIAMIFVSFPFVVRTMQPVLQEMEKEQVEAAWSLGASPWKTFLEVIFPPLVPALLTGTALAFSRAIGEFGSIVIISSNFAFKDLITPVLIFQCLEQYDFVGATVIGTVMLLCSLCIMLVVNWLQAYSQRYRK